MSRPHILIAIADYYHEIADELLLGAKSYLDAQHCLVHIVTVPGAFELPLAIKYALESATPYDGYVALGCVIRGETTHYDYVCGECARGLQQLMLESGKPIGFGVLTVENEQQAKVRADVNGKNKGREAAAAMLAMLKLKTEVGE